MSIIYYSKLAMILYNNNIKLKRMLLKLFQWDSNNKKEFL